MPPEELRRRQLAAMVAWFLAGARTQPVVLAFEDLHWADPTSLDLMQALAERGAQAPLLIVATTRPEFRPPWSLRSHHSVISLAPLDRAGVARMVGEIAARHALSQEVIEGVSERTGGVPLFVEEVTRLLLERGEQGGVASHPADLAAVARRAARPARAQRARSRRSARCWGAISPIALLRDVGGDRRASAASRVGSARRRRPPVRRGRAARGELSLQARADPGRGLRQPAQEPPPGAAPPRRRNPAR